MATSAFATGNSYDGDGEKVALTTQLHKTCGPDFCNDAPCDPLVVFVVLLFFVSCDPEFANCSARVDSLKDQEDPEELDESTTNAVAGAGFSASGGVARRLVRCNVCRKEVALKRLQGTGGRLMVEDLLLEHKMSCCYRILRSPTRLVASLLKQPPFQPFVEHLGREWNTTKVQVVKEMKYKEDNIIFALAHQYQRHGGEGYSSAGDIADYLFDLEFEDTSRPVLWGLAPFVKTIAAESLAKNSTLRRESCPPGGNTSLIRPHTSDYSQRPPSFARRNFQDTSCESPVVCERAPSRPDRAESRGSRVISKGGDSTAAKTDSPTNETSLFDETLSLLMRWRCKRCGKVDADRLIADCGHLALCENCHLKTKACPLCETPITNVIRVFAS